MSAVDFYSGIKWEYPPAPSTARSADLPDTFFNPFRVCELPAAGKMKVTRRPYWMRQGYAEELYEPAATRRRLTIGAKAIARLVLS